MAGRRSISVEPEDLAVASPRRSTRISISRTLHLDSPIPNAKNSDTTLEAKPAPRRRRSQSIQEQSMSDIQEDVKAAKITTRRTSRRLSSIQDEPAKEPEIVPVSKANVTTRGKKVAAQTKTIVEEETDKSSNGNEKVEAVLPRRRVTRSMSTSPVNTSTRKPALPTVALKNRRLSICDILPTETKAASLDIIKENEDEVTEISKSDIKEESSTIVMKEEDMLNINKETDTSLNEAEVKDEIDSSKSVEDNKEQLEELMESEIHPIEENSDEPDVAKIKIKKKEESCDRDIDTSITVLEKSIHNSYLSESEKSVSIKAEDDKEDKFQIAAVDEEIDIEKEKITNISLVQDNKQLNETPSKNTLHDSGDSNISIVDSVENIIVSTPIQKERLPSTLTPLNNISNFELNASKNKNASSTSKSLEDSENLTPTKIDKLEQNISLVEDNGQTYSPIVKNISFMHEERVDVVSNSDKEDNTRSQSSKTNTPKKNIDDSADETKNLSNISKKEMLNTSSTQSPNSKHNTPRKNVDESVDQTKNMSNISKKLEMLNTSSTQSPNSKNITPRKNVEDSTETKNLSNLNISKNETQNTSTQSEDLKNTPKLNKSKNSKSSNINTSKKEYLDTPENSSSTSSSTKNSSKRKESLAKIRAQLVDDYIESFNFQKRKREGSDLDDSLLQAEKKSRKSLKGLEFSEDESNDEEFKNEFIDDEAFEGSENTPSIDSNEIIFEGQSLGSSTSRDSASEDTYENDSFLAPDDEKFDLLSGEEDFLDSPPKKKKKNTRIIDNSSSSEEGDPNLDKMSVEAFGGLSPSLVSEKQISSIDSDLESVKRRNEDLSQQIENGTLKYDSVEKKIDDEVKFSDDDILVVETRNYSDEDSSTSEAEMKKPEIEDVVLDNSQESNEELCLKIDETPEFIENQEQEPKIDDLKHKEILQIFFNNLNAPKIKHKRRDTIDFATMQKIDKSTQTIQKRKRRESFGLEITDIMKEEALRKFEKYRQAAQKNEIPSSGRTSSYEVNSSGIYRVSPSRETIENEEELQMLKDFNNSLNENLEEVIQIKEGKVSKKQKRGHNKNKEILDETVELGDTFFAKEEMDIFRKKTPKPGETVFMEAENEQTSTKKQKKRKSLNMGAFEETENEKEIIKEVSKATEVNKTSPKNRRSVIISDFEEIKIEEFMDNKEELIVDVCKETVIKASPKRRKSLNIRGSEEIENEEKQDYTAVDVSKEASTKKKHKRKKSVNLSCFEESESKEGLVQEEELVGEVPVETEIKTSEKKKKRRKSLNVSGFEETENKEIYMQKEENNVTPEIKASKKKNRMSLNACGFKEIENEEISVYKKEDTLNSSGFEVTENEETVLDTSKETEIKTIKKKKKKTKSLEDIENEEIENSSSKKTMKRNESVETMEQESPKKLFETIAFEAGKTINFVGSSKASKMAKAERRKQKKQRESCSSTSDSEIPILVPIEEPVQKKTSQKKKREKDNKESPTSLKRKIKESLEEQIALVSSSDMILEVTSTNNSSFEADSKYNLRMNLNKKKKTFHSSDSSEIDSPKLPKLNRKNPHNFEIKNEQSTVSKSENYLPLKQLQSSYCYKKLIKPSSFGSAGSNFSVEDLNISLPKINHNKIKKQKKKQQNSIKDKLSSNLKNKHLKEQMLKSGLVKTVNLSNNKKR